MKKIYLPAFIILSIISQISYGQQNSIEDNKSELLNLKKESLQIGTIVELYPNPSIDFLNIVLENSKLKDVKFEMFNIIGNKISFSMDMKGTNKYKINVKEFNSGYYILVISDPATHFNKAYKFRKQ